MLPTVFGMLPHTIEPDLYGGPGGHASIQWHHSSASIAKYQWWHDDLREETETYLLSMLQKEDPFCVKSK